MLHIERMIIMTDDRNKENERIKLVKKIGLIVAGLFLLYVIIGFWVVAPLLKPKLEAQLSGLLGRKVNIAEIKLNPLVLSATISDLTVHEIDGQPFAGFEALYANAQVSSIFKWAFTVREIRVQGPFGVLKLLPDNKLNIDDILAKLSAPKPEPKEEAGLPRAIIEKFQVIDGKAAVENLSGKEPIREQIAPISFTLENLSTLEGRQGEYRFVGVGPKKGQFEIDGKITVNPVRLQGDFTITDTRISHYWEHLKDLVSFQVISGTTDISGEYTVEIVDGHLNARMENGIFELDDFKLVEKGKEEVLIALPTLSIQGIAADLKAREIEVDRVYTANAAFKSWVAADGTSELQRLFQPDIEKLMAMKGEKTTETKAETTDAAPWEATVDHVDVKNWQFTIDARTGKESIRETAALNTFTVENLSSAADQRGTYAFDGIGPSGGIYQLNGELTVNPVWTQGRYSMANAKLSHFWEHIKDHVSFQIVNGSTGASGDFTLTVDDSKLSARLDNGAYTLNDFELVEKGKKEVLVALPAFSIKGIGADLQAREMNVELIQTVDGRIQSWLSPEGTIELQRLFLQDLEKLMKKKKTGEPEPDPAPAQPWQVALKKMEVKNWELAFEDRTLTHPAKLSADNIDVVVENLNNKKHKTATLGVSMRINQAGDVKIKGKAGIVPLQADLNVVTTKIALKSFQPYVDDAVNAQIASGTTSSSGRIRYRGMDNQPQIRYEGDFSVNDVKIQDRVQAEDFITLAQLKTRGIGLELRPNQLNISQVLIDRPHARVTIDEAGVVNVVKAFVPVEKEKKKEEENLLKRLVNLLILQFKGPMPMRVDRVQLKTFTGDFVDASISPSYETHVEITDATATGLSSDPSAKADFKFNGSIDARATLKGSGQMNPMNALQYSKVDVSLNDFELKPVSPYSGKFIGFKIDQGTLRTDLKYQVANDMVDGNHIIIIDQLELGERVDSPDALNLPIKLGVTLLKDSEGRIKVQVPIEGNVKDPQFDFAKAIRNALTGTIEDAGSAPFAAITAVDGFTGEELRTVAFEFGFSELQDREIQKLNSLAALLKEREALTLGIVGTADRRMDRAAVRGESPGEKEPGDAPSSGDEAPAETDTDLAIDDGRLEELAQRRAEKVSAYLTEQAGVDAGRIQVKPVQIKPAPDGEKGFVEFSLSVE
jgi:outer membrane protein OmpA-like peptidoglycan-associated protein